jgi:hypothetical protein
MFAMTIFPSLSQAWLRYPAGETASFLRDRPPKRIDLAQRRSSVIASRLASNIQTL